MESRSLIWLSWRREIEARINEYLETYSLETNSSIDELTVEDGCTMHSQQKQQHPPHSKMRTLEAP